MYRKTVIRKNEEVANDPKFISHVDETAIKTGYPPELVNYAIRSYFINLSYLVSCIWLEYGKISLPTAFTLHIFKNNNFKKKKQ